MGAPPRPRSALLLGLWACAAAHEDDHCADAPPAVAGYDPTKCHPLADAAALPPQCLAPTWSLDPPCPRCWANPSPEYVPGASPTGVDAALRASMRRALAAYLAEMQAQRPPTAADGGTVFSGVGGRALLLLKLQAATGSSAYAASAAAYVAAMEAKLPRQELADKLTGFVGFMWSRVGMLCVSALAADRRGDGAVVGRRVAQVVAAFRAREGKYDDFDSGRAGLLYAARFLDANLGAGAPRVPRALVLAVAQAIVDRGAATGAAHGNAFLQWHGPNDHGLWLGQSHGSAGVLQQLLAVGELRANATAMAAIGATLDHLVASQLPSGNFPTEYYNATQDYLVQWDHGAPGVSAALLAGWRATGNASYLASAERALDVTWRRGLVLKGLMNCHGIGGNTWMQLHAYHVTSDPKYAYRALAFQRTVLGSPLLSDLRAMRQPQPLPDGPWGFWTGSVESAIELWTDLVHRGARNASETAWEPRL